MSAGRDSSGFVPLASLHSGEARPRFYIATFGCRTNQADSAAIREDFISNQYRETERPTEADVIVINSCTVTHRSDQQVRQLTRRLRRENPVARILLTGCYAQRAPDAVALIEGVDAVVGNTRKRELVRIAGRRLTSLPPARKSLVAVFRDGFSKVRSMDLSPATQVGGRTRPYVKLQDGCDASCSYCIIPSVRGPSRSVPPEKILDQVRRVVGEGFREVVLTGIHIGTYGQHFRPRFPLDRLVERLLALPGLGRIRLSSIEPMELSRRIIDLAATDSRLAPHFHICLQSGSDTVLRRMKRPYDADRFAGIVEEIRSKVPHAAIGTDIIAGFPGEAEWEHEESLAFVERLPFTYLHVFPYSDRKGTAAAAAPAKVPAQTVKGRVRDFLSLSGEKERRFRRRFIGSSLEVLTLTDLRDGMREAVSGNFLNCRVAPGIGGNLLLEGRVVGETGENLLVEV